MGECVIICCVASYTSRRYAIRCPVTESSDSDIRAVVHRLHCVIWDSPVYFLRLKGVFDRCNAACAAAGTDKGKYAIRSAGGAMATMLASPVKNNLSAQRHVHLIASTSSTTAIHRARRTRTNLNAPQLDNCMHCTWWSLCCGGCQHTLQPNPPCDQTHTHVCVCLALSILT